MICVPCEKLELKPSMLTGHPVIDDDHRQLIGIVKDINKAQKAEDYDACLRLLADFADFTVKHFQREEDILRETNFPRFVEHSTIHLALMEKFGEIMDKARTMSESPEARESFCCDLVSFLINEAIGADMDFKSHLMEVGVAGQASSPTTPQ